MRFICSSSHFAFLFFQWKEYTLFQVLNVLFFLNIKRNGEHKTLRRKYKALLLPHDWHKNTVNSLVHFPPDCCLSFINEDAYMQMHTPMCWCLNGILSYINLLFLLKYYWYYFMLLCLDLYQLCKITTYHFIIYLILPLKNILDDFQIFCYWWSLSMCLYEFFFVFSWVMRDYFNSFSFFF